MYPGTSLISLEVFNHSLLVIFLELSSMLLNPCVPDMIGTDSKCKFSSRPNLFDRFATGSSIICHCLYSIQRWLRLPAPRSVTHWKRGKSVCAGVAQAGNKVRIFILLPSTSSSSEFESISFAESSSESISGDSSWEESCFRMYWKNMTFGVKNGFSKHK